MYSAYLLWLVKELNWKIQKQRFNLEARKRNHLTIGLSKHGQRYMKPAIKKLRLNFVKAMALKFVQPEDQYKLNSKSYLYLLKLKRQFSISCSIPQSIWLEKHVEELVLVDADPD